MITDIKANAYTIESGKGYFTLFPRLCKGCGLCIEKCTAKTLKWSDKLGVYSTPAVEVSPDVPCKACKMCEMICPDCAISITKK